MPLFDFFTADEARIGLWQLSETVEELVELWPAFYGQMPPPLQVRQNAVIPNGNLKRQKEQLATRLLLPTVLPPDLKGQLPIYDNFGKPMIYGSSLGQISISHCTAWVVVAFHPLKSIGIDIEKISERVMRIKDRFLSPSELVGLDQVVGQINPISNRDQAHFRQEKTTLAWCIKEAVYKWYGKGEVDFRAHIEIEGLGSCLAVEQNQVQVLFKKCRPFVALNAHYKVFDEHVLVWLYA